MDWSFVIRHSSFVTTVTAFLLLGSIGSALTQAPAAPAAPAETPESMAFKAAARAFNDGIYERAETELADFVKTFPESAQVPEAILLRARALLLQGKTPTAIDLLNSQLARAGPMADEFAFWLAEARLRGGDFAAAAAAFAEFARQHTNSIRLLEAGYGEAKARFKLGQFEKVIELLQGPDGAFQRSAAIRANDPFTIRGRLLLAEALLEENKPSEAGQALQPLAEKQLVPEDRWQSQYVECRIDLAAGRHAKALAGTTNLVALANAARQPALLAESVAMQGDLLGRLGLLEEAENSLTQNLGETVPTDYRRRALLRIVELGLARNQTAAAARLLDDFFARYPDDRATDVALLAQGEVLLKEHLTGTVLVLTNSATGAVTTNLLAEAQARFDRLLGSFTNSPLLGKAWLNRGWCLWAGGKIGESVAAFTNAIERLPYSEDLAVARFKLGDALFKLTDFTNALVNYRAVTEQFEALPVVRATLVDQALYQTLRTSLELGDLERGSSAVLRMVREFPRSTLTDRALLLLAQRFAQSGRPSRAREILADFDQRFPQSALKAEAGLAVARTFTQERKWDAAIESYEAWLGKFSATPLRPDAEFNLAWVNWQAGRESNAFLIFTNFVASFPTSELAAKARFWVGDYYFRKGDYPNAEMNYQLLVENTNWPVTRLTYEARMMAGRAAFARQGWINAGGTNGHFTVLVNDANCPPDIAAEAFFALGDTLKQLAADPARPLERFNAALGAYAKIPQLFPASHLVPEAWGMMGNCYLQLASASVGGNPKFYDNALEAYQRAVTNTLANVAVRSQAGIGLAQVLEKQAQTRPISESTNLLEAAFNRYYDIVSEKNLQPGEKPDAFWFKEAGFAAARLAEQRQRWQVAAHIYERMIRQLPPMRETLQARLDKAQEQLRLQKN